MLQPLRFKVERQAKVKDFQAAVAAKVGVPAHSLRIMKRNALFHLASVEVVNEEKNQEKTLSEVRVHEGVNLFIEDETQPFEGGYTGGEASSKWELEFELDRNRFTIKYNEPLPRPAASLTHNDPAPPPVEVKESDYDRKVKMD